MAKARISGVGSRATGDEMPLASLAVRRAAQRPARDQGLQEESDHISSSSTRSIRADLQVLGDDRAAALELTSPKARGRYPLRVFRVRLTRSETPSPGTSTVRPPRVLKRRRGSASGRSREPRTREVLPPEERRHVGRRWPPPGPGTSPQLEALQLAGLEVDPDLDLRLTPPTEVTTQRPGPGKVASTLRTRVEPAWSRSRASPRDRAPCRRAR